MADIRPDRITTCQSERKSVISRRPSVLVKQKPVLPSVGIFNQQSAAAHNGNFTSRCRMRDIMAVSRQGFGAGYGSPEGKVPASVRRRNGVV
jgi:hypothetical protein